MKSKEPESSAVQNEFQWKNLYTKQYGPCTYAPPPSANPTTTTADFPKRRDLNEGIHFDEEFYGVRSHAGDPNHESEAMDEDEVGSNYAQSPLEEDLLDLYDDDMFGANFFDFLKDKKRRKSDLSFMPSENVPAVQKHYVATSGPATAMNPLQVSREMFNLHRNAWMLLMDDRPMAWLERETKDRGRRAADVKQRLLDVVMGLGFQIHNGSIKTVDKRKGETPTKSSAAGPSAEAGKEPHVSYFQRSRGLVLSKEEADHRISDAFNPYFAVISAPSTIRRYREHFFASRRAQLNGLSGAAADIVGMPIFSQFATWRETYSHRTDWDKTPFGFFLMHDACFNYAHISAMFMLLSVIEKNCHSHFYRCLESRRMPVDFKEARFLMTQSRTLRHDVERQYRLCPLFAIQELTENLIIAFEQGTSKNTLIMFMHVLAFVTDCVLDAETANHFFRAKQLLRQAQFDVPGMPTAPGGRASPVGEKTAATGTGEDGEGSHNTWEEDNNDSEDHGNLIDVFSRQIFSTDEFESLFDLSAWFTDNAVNNSRVPIDCDLLPVARYVRVDEVNELSLSLQSGAASKNGLNASPRNVSPVLSPSYQKMDLSGSSLSKGRNPRARFVSTPPLTAANPADLENRPKSHRYIPGREQLYRCPDTLVEVIARYSARREELLRKKKNGTLYGEDGLTAALEESKKGKGMNQAATPLPLGAVEGSRAPDPAPASPMDEKMSLSTTRLSTPLILLSSYVQLHGAPWLRHLLDRVFNVLRKESVLLYVNRLDLEHPQLDRTAVTDSASDASYMSPVALPLNSDAVKLTGLRGRMEYLEDLICQDILYAMSELFSALHGKRSTTRMPQGITTLLTQFCATVHLHLLGNTVLTSSKTATKPGSAAKQVVDAVNVLKQKRLALRGGRADYISDSSVMRLIASVERYRLAKFILFDSWIIPALTGAVDAGYLSESSSLHLRWNVDAFARYLKILVNAPFVKHEQGAFVQPPPPPLVPAPVVEKGKRRGSRGGPSPTLQGVSPAHHPKKNTHLVMNTTPPNTFPLPPYITGIYDVSSGTLVRLYALNDAEASVSSSLLETPATDHTVALPRVSKTLPGVLQRKSLSDESTSISTQDAGFKGFSDNYVLQPQQLASALSLKYALYKSMDTASLDEVSSKLHSLNESLGILNYDPDEQDMESSSSLLGPGTPTFHSGGCAMRVLDLFCRSVACELSDNIVVAEYEVLPSMAAGCVDAIYQFVTGAHPIVAAALETKRIPSAMPFSPYLSCLSAVLLHPASASRVLENVHKNSRRFYGTLMSPLRDQSMLQLIAALIEERDELPLVDSNALTPLLQSHYPVREDGPDGSQDPAVARYENEARRMRRHQHLLNNGAPPALSRAAQTLRTVGPHDPMKVLQAGEERIVAECGVTPLCFDPWWRAMALALCVRAMTVMAECNDNRSNDFLARCEVGVQAAKAEYRKLLHEYIETRGTQVTEEDTGKRKKRGPSLKASPKKKNEAQKETKKR
ncbi:hypothetical protein STCU_06742 [Strigomonas culicis]|uniref:Uncharacterized protein n=1 Tax=Strigomonas culicis TaxID=28005 RepID=S9VEH5_9TRYP|nr:hypothetical protein STCU_06742 [Strigomonas culicis]|eukprot:EPY25501.1 hypothetical protein STCU_06742 [Strigomonas culicis]